MSITLFTDGSWEPKTKAGGWAAWAKGNGRPSRTWHGPLRGKIRANDVTECAAIANGLHCMAASGYLLPRDKAVMIQSDSIQALCVVLAFVPTATRAAIKDGAAIQTWKKKNMPPDIKIIGQAIAAFVLKHGLSIQVRHVRGHKPGDDRQWVNRTVDKLANKGRRGQPHPDTKGNDNAAS